MLKIMEMAKKKELEALEAKMVAACEDAVNSDDVVYALNARRAAEEKSPMKYAQKVVLICSETEDKLAEIKKEHFAAEAAVDRKYVELEAALELPEVNVIEVLKAAGILSSDGTGLA